MSLKRKITTSVLACAVLGGIAGSALTFSAFTSTTENTGNAFASGTVVLSDNDSAAAMFAMPAMRPGDTESKCLTVSYTGTLNSLVRTYATTTSSGLGKELAPFLDVKITRGHFAVAPAAGDMACTDFIPDATDYAAAGPGVVYSSTLASLPTDYAAGLVDPVDWTTGTSATYQVSATLQDDNDAQGKDATTTVTFEARDNPVQ